MFVDRVRQPLSLRTRTYSCPVSGHRAPTDKVHSRSHAFLPQIPMLNPASTPRSGTVGSSRRLFQNSRKWRLCAAHGNRSACHSAHLVEIGRLVGTAGFPSAAQQWQRCAPRRAGAARRKATHHPRTHPRTHPCPPGQAASVHMGSWTPSRDPAPTGPGIQPSQHVYIAVPNPCQHCAPSVGQHDLRQPRALVDGELGAEHHSSLASLALARTRSNTRGGAVLALLGGSSPARAACAARGCATHGDGEAVVVGRVLLRRAAALPHRVNLSTQHVDHH